MYMFPPHGERKRNDIFTAWISVFLRETNTSTIFTWTSLNFFFPFIFLFCSKEGWFVLKGFHCNKKYLTRVPVSEGNKIKSFSAKFKIKVQLWTAIAIWKQRHNTRAMYILLFAAFHQPAYAHLCIPFTHLHSKQIVSRTFARLELIDFIGRDVVWVEKTSHSNKIHTRKRLRNGRKEELYQIKTFKETWSN